MNSWTRRRFLAALAALPTAASVCRGNAGERGLRAGAAKANITLLIGANNGGVMLRGGPAMFSERLGHFSSRRAT